MVFVFMLATVIGRYLYLSSVIVNIDIRNLLRRRVPLEET
jgi:hypothetical protein